ncbi:MAG: hypothetical protein K2N86_02045 [Rikenellaceae bacterium]|nr:hypothetical protein [Rikenellaceae bacterium]MDE7355821.1 hypothetical protein [Rikenellaceae bacterium]
MSSIRKTKKEIDALLSGVISDAYTCMAVNGDKKFDEICDIVARAVECRNELFGKVNNPAEKHNAKLTRKHYQAVRATLFEQTDQLFERLSNTFKED